MEQTLQYVRIENPRSYEPEVVQGLRYLLSGGDHARRDSRRENFYEIDGRDETYYIHVSPITGNVVLLAKWTRRGPVCCRESGCAAA
jgi:hypothetical protein